MKPMHLALLAALLALAAVAGGDHINSAPVATPSAHYNTDMPRFAAGQILILDPKAESDYAAQAADIRTVLGSAVSQSSDGLVEEKVPIKGGGYRVNLQGRFQNAMTMSIDAQGNVTSSCVPAAEVTGKGN
ncbi:MAG TPA: hypothetical protein VJS69_01935 [Candidatus Krumholzibacteria bacterium]|nr:hypothetical protein [Candidatus Krumholzibacteria bacterium]